MLYMVLGKEKKVTDFPHPRYLLTVLNFLARAVKATRCASVAMLSFIFDDTNNVFKK